MCSKARKTLSLWVTCEKCQCVITQKDTIIHEQSCPPAEPWDYGFIKNGIFYSTVEAYKSSGSFITIHFNKNKNSI
jgi:hypothetical protein